MDSHVFITRAAIKPRAIHVFNQCMTRGLFGRSNIINMQMAPKYQGNASKKSKARLLAAVDFLLYTAKWKTVFVKKTETNFRYKVNFITLTLPSAQKHTDGEIIKKVFTPFMEAWQKRRTGLLYVWKAEVQDNGNLHFHVIANSFYHFKKLQNDWNKAIDKLDYCKNSSSENPNSTDVHAISGKKDLGLYLASYMSKKDIYKKPLKRYFKIYGKYHKGADITKCDLPKNYFKNIKRKLTCRTWSASKPLLGIKIIEEYNPKQISWKMLDEMNKRGCLLKSDHCTSAILEVNGFTMFPEFKKAVDIQLEKLFQIQKENVIYETIEEL